MRRLVLVLAYSLTIDWILLGLSLPGIHNAWFGDPAYLIEGLLQLWVLASLGERMPPRGVLSAMAAAMLLAAAWEARRVGLHQTWPLAETVTGVLLGAFCFWRLFELLAERSSEPLAIRPAFWLAGAWALQHSVEIAFYPLHNVFLCTLSREWIVVPWLVKYLIVFLLNFGVARTFLCPKPSSS